VGSHVAAAFEPGGDSSWTAPVKRSTGDLAVLQITVPLPVHHDHVTALRAWSGQGAVRLFAHDPAIRATLMECCVPGIDAADLSPDEADDVAVEVLSQLWAATLPASGLEPLTEAAVQRARVMEARADQHDMHKPATTARVDALADRLGLERQRTRAWLFALATQAASWHLSIGGRPLHDAYSRAASTLL